MSPRTSRTLFNVVFLTIYARAKFTMIPTDSVSLSQHLEGWDVFIVFIHMNLTSKNLVFDDTSSSLRFPRAFAQFGTCCHNYHLIRTIELSVTPNPKAWKNIKHARKRDGAFADFISSRRRRLVIKHLEGDDLCLPHGASCLVKMTLSMQTRCSRLILQCF
jgi:hypothetical protein